MALTSMVAAMFLTGMKLAVGLLTNSLGILSEAAHSGLDLVAAAVTLLAVRVSDRPPDREHPYGHGKVENLSALLETLLLFVTCGWIVYEAVRRLITPVAVEASVWSFLVMGASIAIDLSRSRALRRMAEKHKSQALEADALHFSTDVLSSGVVIAGLAAVWLGGWLREHGLPGADWLIKADAVAALGVAGIVIWISFRLGRRTVDVLIDRASRELTARIEEAVRGAIGGGKLRRLRLRQSGAVTFVDMTLDVPRSASLEEAHRFATAAEEAVIGICPRADVLVHVDPAVKDEHSVVERVGYAAAKHNLGVHGIRVYDVRGRLSITMHIEVLEDLTLGEAHGRVTEFERSLRQEIPEVGEIVTHIEPVGDAEVHRRAVKAGSEAVHRAVVDLPRKVPGVKDCHSITIHREGKELSVSFHCLVNPELPIGKAHRMAEELEASLRKDLPGLGRVVIHVEPPEARDQ